MYLLLTTTYCLCAFGFVFLFFQSDTYINIKGDVVSDWKSCLASIFYIIQKI